MLTGCRGQGLHLGAPWAGAFPTVQFRRLPRSLVSRLWIALCYPFLMQALTVVLLLDAVHERHSCWEGVCPPCFIVRRGRLGGEDP